MQSIQIPATEPETLAIEHIRSTLSQATLGHTIFYYPSVTSTMLYAHQLANEPTIRSGTLIIAEEQTAGRGRLNRRWHSPYGKTILLSLLLRSEHLPSEPTQLVMIAGLAAVEAIIDTVPALSNQCGLKWPNDLLIGKDQFVAQKVGGILIESRVKGMELSYAVVGIGINVNQTSTELPAVEPSMLPPNSLCAHLGYPVNRTDLLINLTQQWEHWLAQSRLEATALYRDWRSHLWTIGKEVDILQERDVICSGTALDVSQDGSLLIRTQQNEHVWVHAGDVSLRNKGHTKADF